VLGIGVGKWNGVGVMPLVKIELLQGRDRKSIILLKDTFMDAVVEALHIPTDDRNIRVIEYDSDLFSMKPPYEILIEISLFTGRTRDTKRQLYSTVVDKLSDVCSIEKKQRIYSSL